MAPSAMDNESHHTSFAAAYVRGTVPELADADEDELWRTARERGLRLHRFKRTAGLPRVRRVLGALKGFAPTTLLDIGSGRGVFLWPLLDELPETRVTAVDRLAHRVRDIGTVARGGIDRLSALRCDAGRLPLASASFDAVTVLEVLEHVERPDQVAREALRAVRQVVVASVPSKEDDNPGHIRLFTPASLSQLFRDAGATGVRVEHVLNHMVAVVKS